MKDKTLEERLKTLDELKDRVSQVEMGLEELAEYMEVLDSALYVLLNQPRYEHALDRIAS